jgi:hypothetical protein
MNQRERTTYQERRAAESAAARGGRKATVPALHRGVYTPVDERVEAVPKTEPYRDAALLELARGRPCLLLVPGVCSHRVDTVVAAHSNFGIHGKGGARKADDVHSCAACHSCHAWLDQPIGHGGPTKAQKEAAFMAAHSRQVLAWRVIATDPAEPERFRNAAHRALEHLNATPLPEED